MPVAKHKLTVNADKINGGAGVDLFIAALKSGSPTLNSDDTLNGGKGIDTIKATLVGGSITPVMKNIEKGIFTTGDIGDVGLDLLHAAQMQSLRFRQSADHMTTTSLDVLNADHVSDIAITGTTNNSYFFTGLDTSLTKTMHVSFDHATGTALQLDGGTSAFKNLHVDLANGSDVDLQGDSINAKNFAISSTGDTENIMQVVSGAHIGDIQNLTISGTQDLTLFSGANPFLDLRTYDSTGMSASIWIKIGGSKLHQVTGGKGTEYIDINTIGGSDASPAIVKLGGGNDYLTLHYAFDAATQHYYGGSGVDTITLEGAAANLHEAAKSFEDVSVNHASGLYDVQGMKLVNFLLYTISTVTTVDHLNSGATLGIYADSPTFLTVNVAHAASSTTDSLRLLMQNSATLGSSAAGFMAPELSHLQIDCYSGDHVMYLGSVGSASDNAEVEITGAKHLELHASNASMSYIDNLVITSSAGADISHLADGAQAFVNTGATITGGGGDDVLVGGDGADTISTGDGNNTVHGSLGADIVTLTANSGLDMFVFDSQAQSSYGSGHDTINGFGTFDGLDITALGINVTVADDVANNTAGIATLSASHATAFFNTTNHTLYIDLNHDKQLDAAHDMQIQLNGIDHFPDANLLS